MTQHPQQSKKTLWWTPRDVPVGHSLHGSMGALELSLGHDTDEWLLDCAPVAEEEIRPGANLKVAKGLPEAVAERFVHAGQSDRVHLSPMLADRPVVIRPRQPIFLLSQQTVTLYLSTPIWLKIQVGEPAVLLKEFPAQPLSDTWFGPSTREGELCYAGRTHARHNPSELPRRPHRAITPLTILNKASTPLPLEKFSLPVPMLALYGDVDGMLWTQAVTLTREGQTDLASVQIDSRPPDAAKGLTRLAPPRQEPGRSGLVRAFSLLFGT
ncbi:MAG: hypothetical protein ACNA7J_05235 [Wenzhouxiangella sp.]